MKIGEIGRFFNSTETISYGSHSNLLEYDAIIIDYEILLQTGNAIPKKSYFERRKTDLETFIQLKKTPLIYFTPEPKQIVVQAPAQRESVTFSDITPVPNISVNHLTGTSVNIVAKTPFTDFLKKYEDLFYYNSYFLGTYGKVIAQTPITNQPLGFYSSQCIFLPRIKAIKQIVENEFLSELINIAKSINLEIESEELPAWASNIALPKEQSIEREIDLAKTKIDELENLLEEKKLELAKFPAFKKLFTASGIELENAVKNIFKNLGFSILDAEDNREDLVIQYNKNIAIVEIKGVSKSASETHAAQLEKWSANYLHEKGIAPKPILIVNSYKDVELNNRTEPAFPNQMIKYSERRDHCLITTLQLLGLWYRIEDNPDLKETLLSELLTTTGVYQDQESWKKYIIQK